MFGTSLSVFGHPPTPFTPVLAAAETIILGKARETAGDLGVLDLSGRFRRFAPLRHRLREAPHTQKNPNLSGIIPV